MDKISADGLFLEGNFIHPMVAFFIAIPTERSIADSAIEIKTSYAQTIIRQQHRKQEDGKLVTYAFPHGMAARRILLYIFSEVYRLGSRTNISLMSGSRNRTLWQFGYEFKKSPTGRHPIFIQLESLYGCNYEFVKKFQNKKANLDVLKMQKKQLLIKPDTDLATWQFMSKRNRSLRDHYSDQDKLYVNPFFGFKLNFPVDFNHVIGTDKKNRFWNVYMFLIDVLPRIEKGKTKKITWSLLHDVFYHRPPNLAHFKNMFKQEVEEVTKLYKRAKDKVITSDKTYLKLKYAPPPI